METVLVVKNTTYGINTAGTPAVIANSSLINTLADGTIVAITPSGKVVPATGFGSTIVDRYFQFVLKTSQGLLRSPLIERDTVHYFTEAYVAPVEQVSVIDFTGAFTAGVDNVGKSAGVIINPFDYVTPLNESDYRQHDVAVNAGDSVANVVTKLVAKINADDPYVTAVVTASVKITLTGKAGVGYKALGMNLLSVNTWSITTNYKVGHGTSDQIALAEVKGSAHKGNNRFKSFGKELYSQDMQTVSGVHYKTIDFSWTKVKLDGLNSNGAPYNQKAMIAGLAGAAMTAVDKILETA